MGTDKRRVATYLPEDLEKAFLAFKIQRGLATEDNPKQNDSKALIQILSEFLEVSQDSTHSVAHYATVDQIDDLHSKVNELYAMFQELKARVSEDVSEVKSELESKLISELPVVTHPGQLDLPLSEQEESVGQDDSNQPLSSGLSGVALADRLNVDRKRIARRRDNPDFSKWTQGLDPKGLQWFYSSDNKKYYPTNESTV